MFADQSTLSLTKKLMVYKLMGSNLFINNAPRGMDLSYKILGTKVTDCLINSTAGGVFTAGTNAHELKVEIQDFNKKNIGGIGNYVVEGLFNMDKDFIDKVE